MSALEIKKEEADSSERLLSAYKSLIASGAPVEHIVSEINKHIEAINIYPDKEQLPENDRAMSIGILEKYRDSLIIK